MVHGRPRRRPGHSRRPAGRGTSRPSAAVSLDRRGRPAPPRLADVRRRHLRAPPQPTPSRDRAGSLPPGAQATGCRTRSSRRARRLLSLAGRARMALDGSQRRRAAAFERAVGGGDFRGPAGRTRPDGGRARPTAFGRGHSGVARPDVRRVVSRCGGRGGLVSARSAARGRGASRRARDWLPRHRGPWRAACLHARAHGAHVSARDWRRRLDHPADQDSWRRRFVRAPRDPALHPRGCADGIGRHLRAHRRSRDGNCRARPRRARDGRGRRGGPLFGHFGLHCGGRVRDQLAARAVDAEVRLFRTGGGQRRLCGLRDGHPRAAVSDDGRARIAGESVDRDAVSGRFSAGLPARGRFSLGSSRCVRAARDGPSARLPRKAIWRAPFVARPFPLACR